jgi:hypothetical protein
MGWIMGMVARWGMHVLIGVCLALGSGLLLKGCEAKRLGQANEKLQQDNAKLSEDLEEARGAIEDLQGANAANLEAVSLLATRLQQEVQLKQDVQAALARTRRDLSTSRQALTMALDNLAKAKESAYATEPSCADWAARPVCSAVTRSVLDQYEALRRGDRDQRGRRASDRAGGDPARPDPAATPAPSANARIQGGRAGVHGAWPLPVQRTARMDG